MNNPDSLIVIRLKNYIMFKCRYSRAIEKSNEIQFDQTIILKGLNTQKKSKSPKRDRNHHNEIGQTFSPT